MGDLQGGLLGVVVVGKFLPLEAQVGEGEAGEEGKGLHPAPARPMGNGVGRSPLRQTALGDALQGLLNGFDPIILHGVVLPFGFFGYFITRGADHTRLGFSPSLLHLEIRFLQTEGLGEKPLTFQAGMV